MAATSSGGREITAMARYQIHAISGTGSLTIPTQEDMTVKGISGSWVSSDLKDRELGIEYTTKRLGVRINDEIKYVQFETGGATGGLQSALAIDNTTGVYDIEIGTGSSILSQNGGGRIDLDFLNAAGELLLSTDDANLTESYLSLTPTRAQVVNQTNGSLDISSTSVALTRNSSGIHLKDNTSSTQSSPDVNNEAIFIGTRNGQFAPGITNSVIVGGSNIVATESNTLYCQNLYVGGSFATAAIIRASADGTVFIGTTATSTGVVQVGSDGVTIGGFGTGSAFSLANILDTRNDPDGRYINGTFSIHNYKGPDILTYQGAMYAGGTQGNQIPIAYSTFRQRAGTVSGPTSSFLIESKALDANGAITVEGNLMVVNYDWGDRYSAKFYGSVVNGVSTYSVTHEIQNLASGTYSNVMNVSLGMFSDLEIRFSPNLTGTTWYFFDYKLTYLATPV